MRLVVWIRDWRPPSLASGASGSTFRPTRGLCHLTSLRWMQSTCYLPRPSNGKVDNGGWALPGCCAALSDPFPCRRSCCGGGTAHPFSGGDSSVEGPAATSVFSPGAPPAPFPPRKTSHSSTRNNAPEAHQTPATQLAESLNNSGQPDGDLSRPLQAMGTGGPAKSEDS